MSYEHDEDYELRMDAKADYYNDMAFEADPSYKYHCGGFSNYSGPCGASDCGDCRNGAPPWEEDDVDEDEDEENTVSEFDRLRAEYLSAIKILDAVKSRVQTPTMARLVPGLEMGVKMARAAVARIDSNHAIDVHHKGSEA